MTIVYRTTGAWGSGKGANLTAAEIDGNFYGIDTRLTAVETNPVQPVQIENITSSGSALTITMDNGDIYGPLVLPTATFVFRGEWAPSTAYAKNDVITNSNTLYYVAVSHTSAATFNAMRTITGITVYQMMVAGGSTTAPMVDVINNVSGKPTNGQKIITPFVRQMVYYGEGLAVAGTAATSNSIVSVKKNTTEIGTLHFNAGATSAEFWDFAETTFYNSDQLVFDFPATADATLANIGINLTFYPSFY